MYWRAITTIESQELMMGMGVADYPHLKAKDRKSRWRALHKAAYLNSKDPSDELDTDELAARLRRSING
jgi:hypothetical protein